MRTSVTPHATQNESLVRELSSLQVMLRELRLRVCSYLGGLKPNSSYIFVQELCVSDRHKQLLLNESSFLPYLVDALAAGYDPRHPRYKLQHELKVWIETTHVDCLHQLSLFPPVRLGVQLLDIVFEYGLMTNYDSCCVHRSRVKQCCQIHRCL